MTSQAALTLSPPRAHGQIVVSVKSLENGRSGLSRLYQQGCARLLTTPDVSRIDGVLLNTSGGLTGGDSIRIQACAETGAHLRLTTQAAERAYRSPDGSNASVANTLSIAQGARLDWLPQETIVFDGSGLRRNLTIDMASDATALIVEPVLFGRLAMGEHIANARFSDRITLMRDRKPLFRDATNLSGSVTHMLDRPALGHGARAMALIVYAAPDAARHLDPVRAALPVTAGASLVQDGLLVARFLAPDGFALRQALIPALEHLAQGALPRSWRL